MKTLILLVLILGFRAQAQSPVHLETLIQRAQNAYFDGTDPGLTFSYFEEIALLRNQKDWNSEERKVIHFSLLRLAQLSEETSQQETWLQEALRFAPELEVDSEIFPPPLTEKYSILKQKQHRRRSAPASPSIALQDLKPHSSPTPSDIQASLPTPLKSSPSIFKNKWFWIGASALLTGYLIYDHNQKRDSEPAPTVTYGL